jgi:hypothetical protein
MDSARIYPISTRIRVDTLKNRENVVELVDQNRTHWTR